MSHITMRRVLEVAYDFASVEGENTVYDSAIAAFVGALAGNQTSEGTFRVTDLVDAAREARSAYYSSSPNLSEVKRALVEMLDDLAQDHTKKDLFGHLIGN